MFAERINTHVAEADRPQLQACLAELQPGDELVVVKLHRLRRTQAEIVSRLAKLQQEEIHTRTLDSLLNTRDLDQMAPCWQGCSQGWPRWFGAQCRAHEHRCHSQGQGA